MAETYAIIESGGKQYRAEKGTTLVVDRLTADEGAKVNLRAVMFRGDERRRVSSADELEKVKVEATVTGHERGEKIRVFKYRAKKGYRKRAGPPLRADQARGDRGQDADPQAGGGPEEGRGSDGGEGREARGEAEGAGEEARRQEARGREGRPPKKPAAKKPAAKKPAAKKPAAKKPAEKKES